METRNVVSGAIGLFIGLLLWQLLSGKMPWGVSRAEKPRLYWYALIAQVGLAFIFLMYAPKEILPPNPLSDGATRALSDMVDQLLPFAITVGLIVALLWQLKTGETFAGKNTRSYNRDAEPFSYWGTMLVQTLVFGGVIFFVIWDPEMVQKRAARREARTHTSAQKDTAIVSEAPRYTPRDSAILLQSRGEYVPAIAAFDILLKQDDSDAELHYWRAVSYWKIGQLDTALTGMRRVIQLQPDNFEAHRYADQLAGQLGRWPEIVLMWDAYIQKHPTSAEAYYERGGTHYHMNQRAAAITDASKACELGLAAACSLVQRLR